MFFTLRQQGYVHHIETSINVITLQPQGFVHPIAMIMLCSSHCDDKAMFDTLRQYAYVLHITMMGLCSSHFDDKDMFDTLLHYPDCDTTMFVTLQHYYVRHVATSDFVCQIATSGYIHHIRLTINLTMVDFC
jgi:hypothetical protein